MSRSTKSIRYVCGLVLLLSILLMIGHLTAGLLFFHRSNVLTVIDTSVDDWNVLRDAVVDPGSPVLFLRAGQEPLAQINAKLMVMGRVDAVRIFSHGSPASLNLSGKSVSLYSLDT